MSLPQYQRCRQSGADWLGIIPDQWSAMRVKTVFEIRKRIAGELGHHVLSVTQQGLKIRNTDSNDGQLSMDYSKYQLVEPDDFVMNHMDLLTGYVDVSKFHGVTSPDYRVFTARKKEVSLKFFLYLFQNGYQQRIFYAFGQGASGLGRWRMPTDSFNDFILPVPPLSEQTAIATFLEHETSKIDALVEEQQRLTELLREKRQAVISRAVTKGIDPNAPMKDCDVEWLGKVPEHWEIKQLRYFAEVLRGKFTHRPRNDPAFYGGAFPFIQTGNITGTDRYITTYDQTLNERGVAVSKEFPRGTLVMAIAANIGDVAVLDFPAYFPDSVVGLLPSSGCDVMFLFYLMIAMKQPMLKTATISTQMNLNVDQIVSLIAACPPLAEQIDIVEFLDRETAKLDKLSTEAEAAITLLQERRGALISAAVTGKIDVRGLIDSDAPISDAVAA
jgi:type I restriction enzyme S subunit